LEKAIDIYRGAEATVVQLRKIEADAELVSNISCPRKSGKKHTRADKPRRKWSTQKSASAGDWSMR